MIRNKVSIERQFDQKLYQFLIPSEGNWNEVLGFAQDIIAHATAQIEAAKEAPVEPIVEEPKAE